jgi:hypothetical protein
MLKSKSVAKIIEDELNSINADEQFKILDSVGDYKGSKINGILKQGKSTITPIMNYINATVPYTLEIIVPYQCGEDRTDNIVNIVNSFIKKLNGKVKVANGGKIIFLFDTINLNEYETRATVGSSAKLGVTFVVNYSNKDVGTKYEMALLNNDFVGTINTRYFKDQEEQYKWYYNKITNAPFSELLTPNINSLVISQQRYINDIGTDTNELSMYNYAIIRETKEDGTINHYYYEVTNANVDQYNILSVDLKMDTLQTWYFNPNIEFDDCFVTKADINRFVQHPEVTNMVKFDTSIDSPLFERENIKNVTKRLVSREVIKPNRINYGGSDVNNWIEENVLGWYYLYLSSNKRFKVGGFSASWKGSEGVPETRLKPLQYLHKEWEERTGHDTDNYDNIVGTMYNTMVCVAFPVMKTNKKMYMGEVAQDSTFENPNFTSNILEFSLNGLNDFISENGTDYIYAMKFSQVCPLTHITGAILDSNRKPSEDGDLYLFGRLGEQSYKDGIDEYTYKVLLRQNTSGFDVINAVSSSPYQRPTDSIEYGMINVLVQYNINMEFDYHIGAENFEFWKTHIVGAEHDIKFNPKLLSSDYSSIVLSDSLQNGAEYDILKLGQSQQTIVYTEALTPDVTRRYIRFKCNDGYYNSQLSENLTGYVVTDDTSVILESSAYQSMLANNKNFFLQNSVNRDAELARTNIGIGGTIASSVLGIVGSAATGAVMGGGIPGAIAGVGIGIANTAVGIGTTLANSYKSQEISRINEELTVDNLKNAPNSINGAKGNVIFNSMYSEMGIVVERHEILPHEKKIVDDNINMYGMTLNRVVNIKDYDNIRRFHNYIEANIEGIKGISISNAIREDIRQRFTNGVRFWNMVDGDFVISYQKENYERWLED